MISSIDEDKGNGHYHTLLMESCTVSTALMVGNLESPLKNLKAHTQ